METANIITATRRTLTHESNAHNIYLTLVADAHADDDIIRRAIAGVGNELEAQEIEQVLSRVLDAQRGCHFAIRVAAHRKAKATGELHYVTACHAMLKANAVDTAMGAAIGTLHKLSFRQHRKVETGQIEQTVYEREQAAYQMAMARLADRREVYQHLSSVWHDEYRERYQKAHSFSGRLSNWLKALSPATS